MEARADARSITLSPDVETELAKCNDEVGDNEEAANGRRVFVRFVFDLVKNIVSETFKVETEEQNPPWMHQKPLTKGHKALPHNENSLVKLVSHEVMVAFNHEKRAEKENMIIRWSQKRRDRVDQVLVRELHAEEASWTKYEDDEVHVKDDLSGLIMDALISDTARAFKKVLFDRQSA
jgi:hypothetical protein